MHSLRPTLLLSLLSVLSLQFVLNAAAAAAPEPAGTQAPPGTPAASAAPAPPGPAAAADYDRVEHWLCRPDYPNACGVDLTTTVVHPDGRLERMEFKPAAEPPIDCFYVYPTISLDATPNSDLVIGPEERAVIQAQFARFGSVCRTFAPLYRQVTLSALRGFMSGQAVAVDRELAYADVRDAFTHYLTYDNQDRGFVLIGHSQGSGVLTQLIAQEIDGKPIQRQLVAALLIGTSGVTVPDGADVGGSFKQIPLCRAPDQTGCVVTYGAFRRSAPPPEAALFGKPRTGDGISACTNPARLEGGSGPLHGYHATRGIGMNAGTQGDWLKPAVPIDTPFVTLPGLLSAECVHDERGYSYLAVDVHGDPADPRTDDISGDVVVDGVVNTAWGLHLIDLQMAQGNLIELVRSQAQAYLEP